MFVSRENNGEGFAYVGSFVFLSLFVVLFHNLCVHFRMLTCTSCCF